MENFNPELHLLAINANVESLKEANNQLKKRIPEFFNELVKEHPLTNIHILDEIGPKELQQKISEVISSYLLYRQNTTMSVVKHVRDGFFSIHEKGVKASTCIKELRPLLKHVGLYPKLCIDPPNSVYIMEKRVNKKKTA